MSLEKLVSELGLEESMLTSLTDENLNDAKEAIVNGIKSKLLEDEEFYRGIDKARLPKEFFNEKFNEGVNKIAAQSKGAIDKHFGITEADKAEFSEEERKEITRYIARATEIYKSKTNNNKDLSTLQDENLSLKQQIEANQLEMKSVEEKFNSDFNEKLTVKETEWLAKNEALSLQKNVPVSVGLVFDKVFNTVKLKYNVVIEDGVAQIRKKDNPTFKVQSANGKEYMTLKDALIEELKSYGAWSEGQAAEPNKVVVPIQPNRAMSDKIKQKMEEEARFFG
jgi:hypothetical protein